jgi:hypothetical protein
MKQGPTEKTRAYVHRFTKVMKGIDNCSDKLTLIILQRGLRNGGLRTLKYDSYQKSYRTFTKFLTFAKGYMRGEDNTEPPQRNSRSPSPRVKKVFTPERSKEEIQEKKPRSNPMSWTNTIPVQQGMMSMPSQYFNTTNHEKSQCDFAFKANLVPKLWATT